MTDDDLPDEDESPRAWFTRQLKDYAREHPELGTSDVAAAVTINIMRDHAAFIENYFVIEGISILSFNLRTSIVQTRGRFYKTFDLRAESLADEQPEPPRLPSIFTQIKEWREFDPGEKDGDTPRENRGRLLLTLDRPALQRSAHFDTKMSAHFGWKADFKLKLAQGLPDDVTTVEEFYTSDQLLDMLEESKRNIKKQLLSGNLKIRLI